LSDKDAIFAGSVPAIYDRHMGPLFFEPFAAEMTRRLLAAPIGAVLETAAGTGILTARLATQCADSVAITSTDLNPPMLDLAAAKPGMDRVRFKVADAQALPFPDGAFDVVICQFGVMFFPDRVAAYGEARRVLAPGGRFLFSAWDSLTHCPVPRMVLAAASAALAWPGPWFLERTPHGYHEVNAIERDLRAAGWTDIRIETLALAGRADSAHSAAVALCQGTPMRDELAALGNGAVATATEAATAAIARVFGDGPFKAAHQAHIVEASH
jgi:ubiquinone/menaquinone biosynthesis C-methylase UbiE